MSDRPIELSPGAVAERLGISYPTALAAIKAADLRDDRGRPKAWFSEADLPAIQAQLRSAQTSALTESEPGPGREHSAAGDRYRTIPTEAEDDQGEPEPVSAEDLATVEQELGRPVQHRGRRRR